MGTKEDGARWLMMTQTGQWCVWSCVRSYIALSSHFFIYFNYWIYRSFNEAVEDRTRDPVSLFPLAFNFYSHFSSIFAILKLLKKPRRVCYWMNEEFKDWRIIVFVDIEIFLGFDGMLTCFYQGLKSDLSLYSNSWSLFLFHVNFFVC